MSLPKQTSADRDIPAISGENTGGGDGILGWGKKGVVGVSETADGVHGESHGNGSAVGVRGVCPAGTGVYGESTSWRGVYGKSETNAGVVGESKNFDGVWGVSYGKNKPGVSGRNYSEGGVGVFGESKTWRGVHGYSETNAGVVGESRDFDGVWGVTRHPDHAGVSGHCLYPNGSANPDGWAGWFEGKVLVTNDIVLMNADCAEDFDVTQSEQIEPGTVMVLSDDGVLHPSRQSYDKKVAGVVSGAGNYKPGIVLDKRQSQPNRKPIALLGKVYCKVDASHQPIEVGDLLTTSDRRGHAMKATDTLKAFGSIIGKALRPLKEGQSVIPILIALQ
jgi:hypothetical protein